MHCCFGRAHFLLFVTWTSENICRPKAVRRRTDDEASNQAGETQADLRSSSKDAAEATAAAHRTTDAAPAGSNSQTKAAAAGMLPGAEVAEIVSSTNVVSGKVDVAAAATLDKYATESARSGCLGLQYDSDDESEDDSE